MKGFSFLILREWLLVAFEFKWTEFFHQFLVFINDNSLLLVNAILPKEEETFVGDYVQCVPVCISEDTLPFSSSPKNPKPLSSFSIFS